MPTIQYHIHTNIQSRKISYTKKEMQSILDRNNINYTIIKEGWSFFKITITSDDTQFLINERKRIDQLLHFTKQNYYFQIIK